MSGYMCGPVQNMIFLQRMINEYQLNVAVQSEGDLGDKMHHAMTQQGYPAAVMGCDVPHCPADVFQQAFQLLQEGKKYNWSKFGWRLLFTWFAAVATYVV